MALVSAKGEKVAVRIQGPYCALPRAQPAGRLPSRPLASSSRLDGIIIIAGQASSQWCLSRVCVSDTVSGITGRVSGVYRMSSAYRTTTTYSL